MAFKPPGGELTFWSLIWFAFGLFSIYFATVRGQPTFYFFALFVGLPALGMWFEQRWCGYLFAAFLALMIPLAVWTLITIDDTLSERALRLIRIATALYFISLTYRWARGDYPPATDQTFS